MALEGTHEEPGTFTSGVRDDAPTFGLIVSKSDEGGFPAESFFNVHPIIERVPVNGETQTMISEGPVTLVAPILAVEPRVVFPRPVIGNTPPDLNDILPLLDLDSGRPIAELIHALHVPEEPVDNCPRDIKWNNPPNPNDEGTPIPSNIDWNDHDPNKVTADDLVSNGRSILAVRSWARTSIGDSSRRSSAVTESGRSTAGTSAPTPIESRRSPKSFSDSTSVAPRTSRSRGRSSETVRSTDLRVLRQAARLLPRSHPHS